MSIFAEYGHFSQTNVQSGQEISGNFPYSSIHVQKGCNQYVNNEMVNEAKMKSGTIINENQDSLQHTNGINEVLLRSEISFWDDMIAGCDPAHSLESLERMQQALALAESRLATLPRACKCIRYLEKASIQRLFHFTQQCVSSTKFQIAGPKITGQAAYILAKTRFSSSGWFITDMYHNAASWS